ncbi:thioesterase [Rhodococcus erythropolis]|nr:acyl-ACP thioesterase domain-containing protein [Rhodococcus erythropolis]MCQ4127674.1 thioesterase [Rhodococcus erythropolis]
MRTADDSKSSWAVKGAGTPSFEAKYRVRGSDVTPDLTLRFDSVARFLQDVATDDLAASSFGSTDPYWIVRRTIIDVLEPIAWPGAVSLERWCSGLSTRWANMRVRIVEMPEINAFNPAPRRPGVIETESFWINVNVSGFPARISDEGFRHLSVGAPEERLRWQSMNSGAPAEQPSVDALQEREHVIRATDFDPFGHVNNSAYWAVVEDELTEHPDIRTGPHRAVIEYLKPVTPDSRIMLRRRRVSDRLSLWLLVNDTVVATVVVTKG